MTMKRRTFLQTTGVAGASSLIAWRARKALALPPPIPLLDPKTVEKFRNPLPNPLDPGFVFEPMPGTSDHYEIGIFPTLHDPGLGLGATTLVWAYGNKAVPSQGPTYPGRTFVTRADQPITVQWSNDLVDASGMPLPHLFPVDTTIHWADPATGTPPGTYPASGVPIVPHLHGGHTESASDGLPEHWWTPGEAILGPRFVKSLYSYANDQEAATLWYHDHALGITRLNVYAGLAGFYIVRDENEDFLVAHNQLPTGPYEIPLVIQDRLFLQDGSLSYPTAPPLPGQPDPSILPEMFGNVILVNGTAWPFLEVEPRQYRFRLLNGSDSAFYVLSLSNGQKIFQIGSDQGLLNAPVARNEIVLAPAERADVIVDFSRQRGKTLLLRNMGRQPFPKGAPVDPATTGQVMELRVKTTLSSLPLTTLPDNLRPVLGPVEPLQPTIDPATGLPITRRLLLAEGTDSFGRLMPLLGVAAPTRAVDGSLVNGSLTWTEEHDPITENPGLGTTEIWEIYNTTPDAHPIHLHLVAFRVEGRQKLRAAVVPKQQLAHDGSIIAGVEIVPGTLALQGKLEAPPPGEAGRKDTVQAFPGEVTRIIARFDRPGRYVWHCHILSHEDHEMMRPYHVGPLP